jgi:hypothetical protein
MLRETSTLVLLRVSADLRPGLAGDAALSAVSPSCGAAARALSGALVEVFAHREARHA